MRPNSGQLKTIAALSSLENASSLLGLAKRMYSRRSLHSEALLEKNEGAFTKAIDSVAAEFRSHPALKHPFFDYLKEQSKDGFNSIQFQIYRDNFFCRTELTIPSVARAIEKAALSGDLQTVADTVRNIYDEGGYGDPKKIHSKLLLDSHNDHGLRVFGVEKIPTIRDIKKSKFLIPEVEEYRKSKIAVFNKQYPYIAGNTWAHELAADDMLVNFREAFFETYKGYYAEAEYDKLIEFYKAHKDDEVEGGDVEAQHERMARGAAERACKESLQNVPKMREGGLEFLDRQAALWSGLLREMEKAQMRGGPIMPKSEFRTDKNTEKPKTAPKKPEVNIKSNMVLS